MELLDKNPSVEELEQELEQKKELLVSIHKTYLYQRFVSPGQQQQLYQQRLKKLEQEIEIMLETEKRLKHQEIEQAKQQNLDVTLE